MSDGRRAAFVQRAVASGGNEERPAGFLLRAEDTGGLVSILEFGLEGWQSGPDLHLHTESDESFYVLDGELEMQVGDERHVLTRGDFAWVPRGVAHTFANATAAPARALTVATPGGLENFLAAHATYLAEVLGRPDHDALADMRVRHGGRLLGPPIHAHGKARQTV